MEKINDNDPQPTIKLLEDLLRPLQSIDDATLLVKNFVEPMKIGLSKEEDVGEQFSIAILHSNFKLI